MCGLVAISAPGARNFPIDASLVSIAHRGPDDRGVFVSETGDAIMGHNRLSIFDVSHAGHQPMQDQSGRYVIAFNGEIYNFRTLRSELEKRHGAIHWKSECDTEVIVEGFAREGVGFLDRLNGIFALVLYDNQEQLIHVLRDPLGIKPLFATRQHGGIFLASEIKGLLAIPALERSRRLESFAEQLAFMYVPEPHTPYCEFFKIEPGVCFSYRAGELVAQRRLFGWLDDGNPIQREDDALDALRHAFARAVERQVEADVPVSLFLSGGIDSSAVAEFALRSGANIRDAYTIAVSDEDRRLDAQGDDLQYAQIMADRLGIKLNVIPAKVDLLDMLADLSRFMEDGFSDPAAINTYVICEGARQQGVKVMLSGHGADEFLGGYRRYIAERTLQRIPGLVRRGMTAASGLLPANLPGRLNAFNRRVKRMAGLAGQEPGERILGLYSWASPGMIDSLFVEPLASHPGDAFGALLGGMGHPDCVDSMMELDRQYDLLSLNLTYTDRMSMAVGVEARVPFLDFELVRVMNSIPTSMKVRGRQGKHIFKKAMEPYIPREIIYRSKAGFGLPLRAWLNARHDLLDHYLDRQRIESQGIFRADAIDGIRRENAEGAADHTNLLFTLLVQQIGLDG